LRGQPHIGAGLFVHWQPEKARVAAVVLLPAVTVKGAFDDVTLVWSSDGLQSGVLVPSVMNARASTV
jgi:hypothetical protein